MEGNYIPPMPGLPTKKWKCKQRVWVTGKARTKHNKIKLMAYIQYVQKSWWKEKEKNKKISVCQLHNKVSDTDNTVASYTIDTATLEPEPTQHNSLDRLQTRK